MGTEKQHTPQQFQLDDLTIDLERYRITHADGTTTLLTEQEQRLLRVLIEADGRVVTKEQLGKLAWGFSCGYSIQGIWNCVKRLRHKLGDSGKQQRYIKTVHSIGLCIEVPAPGGRDVH